MGYARFIVGKTVSYVLALFGAVSILYVAIYPTMQKVIQASANEAASDFQRNLIKGHSDLTLAQIQTSVATFKASYLATFGFNQSLPVKYVLQMANLFQFHLGSSFFLQSPQGSKQVIDIIVAYLPNTILLFTTGTLLVVGVGAILGLLAARSAGGKLDRSIPIIAVIHSSLPTWWIGFILIAYFAYSLNILPSGGISSVPPPSGLLQGFGDLLYHMTLPLASFFIVNVGGFAYVIRSLAVSTMGEDFVTTARARGMTENRVLFRHVLRTASPSIATQSILVVAGSFGGAITTEVVFRWPGIGFLTFAAIIANDLPVIVGSTFILTIILFLGLYIGELTYGLLDPRIKTGD
ncbi:MAG: ABC transporter permease [Thaumarchaeota archaeon]|nr:ABC transporter permease [Nitrososphaerota archaeon]